LWSFSDSDVKKFTNKFVLLQNILAKCILNTMKKIINLFFDTTISAKVKIIFAAAALHYHGGSWQHPC
jgi:hypothetical protein